MTDEDRVAAYDAARGRTLLLGILWVSCAVSAVMGLNQILSESKPPHVPVIRFGLTVLLAYFVYRGSLVARVIFAVLCVTAALMVLYYSAIAISGINLEGTAVLVLLAGYYLLAAWAVFGSAPIRAFWASRLPTTPDADKTT